jgi:hypothetical protein
MPHDTPVALREARLREESMNGQLLYTPDNASFSADPPYKVYVFNLGPTRHMVEKGSCGTFVIPACDPDQAISNPLVLPSVVRDSFFVEQEMKTHSVSGEFMAQDIVHPITSGGKSWWSFGANLDDLGVFYTRNETPTEQEIAAAREKMETTYRKLLAMASSIEAAGRIDDITPLMRIAASYFGEDRSWNRIYKKTTECPGCGEPAKQGIIRHPCGFIFDPDRALLAGMIGPELHAQMLKLRKAEGAPGPKVAAPKISK